LQSEIHSLSFGSSLGGRPITLTIHNRNTKMIGIPVIPTGDPTFDQQFVVNGWPTDTVRRTLDESFRRWLVATKAGQDPNFRTDKGFLLFHETLRVTDGASGMRVGRVPSVGELAGWIEAAEGLAERMCAWFDRESAEIEAAHGTEAASAWAHQHIDAMHAREKRRKTFRIAVFVAIGLVFLIPLLLTLLIALGAVLVGCSPETPEPTGTERVPCATDNHHPRGSCLSPRLQRPGDER
jgi:hypothetical protein